MFDYNVMTEEEAMRERFQLLEDGAYDAIITKITPKQSNGGNPMFDLMVDVYDINGKPSPVRDFLIFTNKTMWKVIHCAESSGTLNEYKQKKFSPEILQNKKVRVFVKQQQGDIIPTDKLKGKPEGSRYPDKNIIEDYLVDKPLEKFYEIKEDEIPFSDEIPF